MENQNSSKRELAAILGIVVVLLAVFMMAAQVFGILSFRFLWPLLMIAPIVFFIPLFLKDNKKFALLWIPSVTLIFLSLYFILLNYAGWNYISISWPNFILAPGLGLFAFYLARKSKGSLVWSFLTVMSALIGYGVVFNSKRLLFICSLISGVFFIIYVFSKKKK
jgi:hypothetical protein